MILLNNKIKMDDVIQTGFIEIELASFSGEMEIEFHL